MNHPNSMSRYFNILIFLLGIGLSIKSQNQVFSTIDTRSGLSDNRIRYILQLPDGRMAISSEGATNLYDGTSVKRIHLKKDDYLPLPGYVGFLANYADSSYLWIKYNGRLIITDIRQESYVTHPLTVFEKMGIHEPIVDFFVDLDKNYWIQTSSDKLLYRDARSKSVRVFLEHVSNHNGIKDDLADIVVVNKRVYLFFRFGLVACYDLNTGRRIYAMNALSADDQKQYTGNLRIASSGTTIFQVRNTTFGPGILLGFDIRQRKFTTILKSAYWLNIPTVDKAGNLWVSGREGLWIIDKTLKNKQFVSSFKLSNGTNLTTEITSQYQDKQGGLWIGTLNKGVLYYHHDRFKFRNIGMSSFSRPKEEIQVTCFAETDQQNILVGTTMGLYQYEPKSNTLAPFPGVPATNCFSMTKDSRHRIWICTHDGVFCLTNQGLQNYKLQDKDIQHIVETPDGYYFAATGNGIGTFDEINGIYQRIPFPKNMSKFHLVYQLLNFNSNQLLCRAYEGLFVYDYKKRTFPQALNSRIENNLFRNSCMYKDSRGLIWIGTPDCLRVLSLTGQEIRVLNTDDGLVNSNITGITEDQQGRIWLTTTEGVSCITVTKKGTTFDFAFANFNQNDGVFENEFTSYSHYVTTQNLLLLGGINGFSTMELQKKWAIITRLQKPLFTSLLLFGEKVKPGQSYDGNIILKNSVSTTDRIVLKYNQNFIGVEFSALNYVNPTQTYYRYRLEGVDERWREISAQNGTGMASYTNLSPGTYRLMVMAANNSKEWTHEYAVITIKVTPPFWKTPLAYALYLIIALFILYYSLWYYKQWTHNQMTRKNEEKLNRMKFNFFTNISHEFRTPLTLIITPMESLLKEVKDTALEPKLRTIYRHARDLQGLVNQLLDFRRLEEKGEKLHLTFGNVVEFVKQFDELFARMAQEKGIAFSVQSECPEIYIYFDREKIYRILNNLLSNAFKYTSQGGGIQVDLSCNKEQIQIQVIDSGKGISQDELPRIFNRFYQASDAQIGSGIGLHLVKEYAMLHSGTITVESEPDKRTCFTLTFPMNLAPLKAEPEAEFVPVEQVTGTATTDDPEKNHKILVVEDNDDLRGFLVSELSKSYVIVEAADGEAGLEVARTVMPDLIISDVMMPKMNGLELCHLIKSDLRTSHIPVILLTARASEEHKLQGYQSGADEYLPKPFNLDILLLRIAKLIEQQHLRQEQFIQKIEVNPKEITITSLDKQLIEKALACIERNMDNPEYTVQQFSIEIGMDRTVLYKKLQTITGLAPSEFIRSIRLKRAAQLLAQGQLSVGEVADRVGFQTARSFSKNFREEFGVLPSQYNQQGNQGQSE